MPVALIETVGAASAILFLQRLVLEKLIIGNLVGDTLVALLQGGRVHTRARDQTHGRPDA